MIYSSAGRAGCFSLLGYCKQCCWGQLCSSFCLNTCFQLSGVCNSERNCWVARPTYSGQNPAYPGPTYLLFLTS